MIRVAALSISHPFDLERALSLFVSDLARDAEENAQELLSGQTPSTQLRRSGHPYGRTPARHGGRGAQRGAAPRLPINIQSGDLWRHLYIPQYRFGFTVSFPGTRSAFVLAPGGTRNMIARGYAPELYRRMLPLFRRGVRSIVRNAKA